MDTKIKQILDVCRCAMIYMQGNRIEYANRFAADLMGTELIGRTASYVFPDGFPNVESDSYTTAMTIRGKSCTVCVEKMDNSAIISITPDAEPNGELVSSPMLDSLTASLCNMNLSMKLICEKLRDSPDTMDEYMSVLYHSYYMVKRTVSNLRSASELRNHTMPYLPVVADLALLCSDLASSASIILGPDTKVSLTTEIGELPVLMEPDYIERMLLNLIANSCIASDNRAVIDINLKKQQNRAVITISDNGCGISADKMRNVFTSYASNPTCPTQMAGSGLGLSVAKGIAELHGGSIMISSRPGQGTKVTVILPIAGGILETPAVHTTNSRSMDMILTELSTVLRSESYTESFRD